MTPDADSAGDARGKVAVTVSLVTFNGMRWLPACMESLAAQDATDYELLILDNASTDGSLDWLRTHAAGDARVTLIESAENLGYARAHNRTIARARGEFICLLNQDMVLDSGFLRQAVAAFASDPNLGSVQARVRSLAPDGTRTQILDSTGLVMRRDRRFFSRSQGEPETPRDLEPGPVFGADGPVPVYRASALLDVRLPATAGGWEVLDEDFFMYKEDVDLAWRLRLMGWGAWYEPAALAWHARAAAGSGASGMVAIARANRSAPGWIRAISWRNQRLMQVKNEEPIAFIRDLPWIAWRELLALGFILLADPGRLRILPSAIRLLRPARRKRRYLWHRIRSMAKGELPPRSDR